MFYLILRDRNGVDYEVKDPKRFSNHIFNVHGEGHLSMRKKNIIFLLIMISEKRSEIFI